MASMVPYRSVFGIRPTVPASLFDAFDDMMDLTTPLSSKAFPIDVEDKGDGYEVKAYFTGVSKDDIDVELSKLFVERMELCEEIGKIKAAKNKPVEVSSREQEIIERVTSGKPEKFKKYIGLLYSEIFKLSKKYQSGKARQS